MFLNVLVVLLVIVLLIGLLRIVFKYKHNIKSLFFKLLGYAFFIFVIMTSIGISTNIKTSFFLGSIPFNTENKYLTDNEADEFTVVQYLNSNNVIDYELYWNSLIGPARLSDTYNTATFNGDNSTKLQIPFFKLKTQDLYILIFDTAVLKQNDILKINGEDIDFQGQLDKGFYLYTSDKLPVNIYINDVKYINDSYNF